MNISKLIGCKPEFIHVATDYRGSDGSYKSGELVQNETSTTMIFAASSFALLATAIAAPLDLSSYSDAYSHFNVKSCDAYLSSPYAAFSCQATSQIPSGDKCCYQSPNGIVMQTQFWDYSQIYVNTVVDQTLETLTAPNTTTPTNTRKDFTGLGSADQLFTIHGLWNDLCNGKYNQFCNDGLNVQASDLKDIITQQFDDTALYNKMQQVWINGANSNVADGSISQEQSNINLWEHEYNKHGTCMSTLQPDCYKGSYQQYETAYDFYRKVVEVWDTLPTYDFLANAGITPSAEHKYKLSDVQAALSAAHNGTTVYVGCADHDAISEIWYYHVVKGNILTGIYKPIDSLTKSTCPDTVRYLPKH